MGTIVAQNALLVVPSGPTWTPDVVTAAFCHCAIRRYANVYETLRRKRHKKKKNILNETKKKRTNLFIYNLKKAKNPI